VNSRGAGGRIRKLRDCRRPVKARLLLRQLRGWVEREEGRIESGRNFEGEKGGYWPTTWVSGPEREISGY